MTSAANLCYQKQQHQVNNWMHWITIDRKSRFIYLYSLVSKMITPLFVVDFRTSWIHGTKSLTLDLPLTSGINGKSWFNRSKVNHIFYKLLVILWTFVWMICTPNPVFIISAIDRFCHYRICSAFCILHFALRIKMLWKILLLLQQRPNV